MITSPEQAIAEAIRTGKSVEVHRADGSVRVVVSGPGAEESDAAVVVLADAVDALTKRLAAVEKERDELRTALADLRDAVLSCDDPRLASAVEHDAIFATLAKGANDE